MASTSPPAPKVTRSLRIVGQPRPKLLDLPRELRDEIWSYVLIEPALRDRRHKSGCPFHDSPRKFETPAIELLRGEPRYERHHRWFHEYHRLRRIHDSEENGNDLEQCLHRCVRRKSMALLRVNRQLYTEATEIFWAGNTICLNDRREAKRLLDIGDVWHNAFTRVQSLVLWETSPEWEYDFYHRVDLYALLSRMTALRRLEMPAESLWMMDDIKNIVLLPKLTEIRLWQVCPLPIGRCQWLFVGRSCLVKLPTACNTCRGRRCEWDCLPCMRRRIEVHVASGSRWLRDHIQLKHTSWASAARRELERKQPTRNQPGPHILHVTTYRGPQQLSVWGLETYEPGEWEAYAKAESQKKALDACRKGLARAAELHKQWLANKRDVHDDGDFALATKGDRRSPVTVEKRVDHEKILEDRKIHRKRQAKAERVQTKEEVRKVKKEAQAERETEKKAARRRTKR